METLNQYRKALVALVMALLTLVELWTGWTLSNWLNEETIVSLFAVLTPILVWAVPNKDRNIPTAWEQGGLQ